MRRNFLVVLVLPAFLGLLWSTTAPGLEVWIAGTPQNPWSAGEPEQVAVDTGTRVGWLRPDSLSTLDNLALGAVSRGGSVSSPQGVMRLQEVKDYPGSKGLNLMGNMVDGDLETVFEMDDKSASGTLTGFAVLDLGTIVPGVRLIRFYPREGFQERFMRGYAVAVNDGSPQSVREDGVFIWKSVAFKDKNSEPVVEIPLPQQPVRYVRLQSRTTLPWEVAELEVYGGGYVNQASHTSGIIDVGQTEGGLANLGRLTWSARTDPRARLEIRTRSGKTPDPLRYFQLIVDQEDVLELPLPDPAKSGTALEQYENLPEDERISRFDTDNWSFWSPPYTASGMRIVSPSPRRYFQFKIDLFSELHSDRVELDSLAFEFSSPIMVHGLNAEISPQLVAAGEVIPFSYTLQMEVREGDTGFDALEVVTPVAISSLRDFKVNDVSTALDSQRIFEDRFRLYFPRITGDDLMLSFAFDGQVLVYGTQFESQVFDRQGPEEVPQIPDPETSRLAVNVRLDNTMLRAVKATPNPFTPNGDRVNDRAVLSYQVLKVLEPVPVSVEIRDLANNLVRVFRQEQTFGIHRQVWDGTDAGGRLVPPGLYLYRIEVETKIRTDAQTGIVGIAY